MYKVDLNCDLGESFGAYKIGGDGDVIPFITSANVACGYHAGDPSVMAETVALCKKLGVSVGAHPGFRDLEGFGRRNMSISEKEAENLILYQVGSLDAFCRAEGVTLQHVKPHGALYNMAAKDKRLASAICRAVYKYNPSLVLLGLAGSEMLSEARAIGLPCASEVFADREYEDDGTLVSRSKEGSVIHDSERVAERVVQMVKEHTVKSVNGKTVEILPDSICVHGDNPEALELIRKIREALARENIAISPLKNS